LSFDRIKGFREFENSRIENTIRGIDEYVVAELVGSTSGCDFGSDSVFCFEFVDGADDDV
jgi:hypothetical protein